MSFWEPVVFIVLFFKLIYKIKVNHVIDSGKNALFLVTYHYHIIMTSSALLQDSYIFCFALNFSTSSALGPTTDNYKERNYQ